MLAAGGMTQGVGSLIGNQPAFERQILIKEAYFIRLTIFNIFSCISSKNNF